MSSQGGDSDNDMHDEQGYDSHEQENEGNEESSTVEV